MRQNGRITAAIEPTVEGMGFRLVRATMSGTTRPVLQIMAEPTDGGPMTVEHCADLSRALSAVLDVEDPIGGAYTLEVSSPGVDRPLTRLEDFERYAGFDARVELERPMDGRKKVRGKLIGVDDAGRILVREGDEDVALAFDDVRRAKLVLTDALMAAHAAQNAQGDEG